MKHYLKNVPPSEVEIILAHILKKSREYVLAHPEIYPVEYRQGRSPQGGEFHRVKLTEAQKRQFNRLVKRRQNHEPMAYILGHKEFYGLDFKVAKDTLIPRPETEMLVEKALRNMELGTWNKNEKLTVIDIGTGSGNIIISIAKNIEYQKSNIEYKGIDISSEALKVARTNAKKHKVDKKIKFIKSDLLDFLLRDTKYQIQDTIIAANLPYLSKTIYNSAIPDVKKFEPRSALVSGKDGLDHYEKLFKQLITLRQKCSMLHATCYMEISPEQKSKITKLITHYFPKVKPEFKKDLAGKWRMVTLSIAS